MGKFICWLLLSLIAVIPMRISAAEPKQSDQTTFIKRAVYAEERLWVLPDAGDLFSISEEQSARIEVPLPDPVLDLCIQDDHPLVVTANKQKGGPWILRRHGGAGWEPSATINSVDESLLAVDCAAHRVTLLTTRRLIEIDGGGNQRTISLRGKLGSGVINSPYSLMDYLFIGFNAGEWGGGLSRIDRRTGEVTIIERNSTGALCGGPLNSFCDPVNGIASAPWNPDCLVAAVGLVHFEPHGRIVEVCGTQIERLYFKPYGERVPGQAEGDEPFSTVAFFGLARADAVLWAVGMDGLYQLEKDGGVRSIALPGFKEIGGVRVSFDIPHLIVILTDINKRVSISEGVPMLIPR